MTTELFQYGVRFQDNTEQSTAAAAPNRNLILNGSFEVDQRNLGVLTAGNSANIVEYIGPDRWCSYGKLASKFQMQQITSTDDHRTFPFSNYLRVTTMSTFTMGSLENYRVGQRIPAEYTAGLKWGIYDPSKPGNNAGSPTVLSFWVRSGTIGPHSGSINNFIEGGGDIQPFSFPFSFTINSSDTWEKKIIAIPAPPASLITATEWNSYSVAMTLNFCFGADNTYAVATAAANTWVNAEKYWVTQPSGLGYYPIITQNFKNIAFTGIQFEKGTVATELERVEYASELAECQRYYRRMTASTRGYSAATNTAPTTPINFSSMRAMPTITIIAGSRTNAVVSAVTYTNSTAGHRCGSTATGTTVAEGDIILLSAEL